MASKTIFRAMTLTALFVLSINPVSAQLLKTGASVFNYNYIDGAYINDGDADGIRLAFSANIRPNYALQVGYTRLSDGPFDADVVDGGLAYHIATAKYPLKADWVFNLGFQIIDFEGIDETGLDAGAGIRYAVNQKLEVNGSIHLTTAFDTDLALRLAALYEVSTGLSAFVDAEISDDTTLSFGARYYWR